MDDERSKRPRTSTARGSRRTKGESDGEADDGSVSRSGQRTHVQTEQRRRDRIKEGFDTLRKLIPHREGIDKAGFLLQAIDYVTNVQQIVQDLLKTGLQRHMSQELQIRLQSLLPNQTPIVVVADGAHLQHAASLEGSLHNPSQGVASQVMSIPSQLLLPQRPQAAAQQAQQLVLTLPQQHSAQDLSSISPSLLQHSSLDALHGIATSGAVLNHSQAALMDALRSTHGSQQATLALQSAAAGFQVGQLADGGATRAAGAPVSSAPVSGADSQHLEHILQLLHGHAAAAAMGGGPAPMTARLPGEESQHNSHHGSSHVMAAQLTGVQPFPQGVVPRALDTNQLTRLYGASFGVYPNEGSVHSNNAVHRTSAMQVPQHSSTYAGDASLLPRMESPRSRAVSAQHPEETRLLATNP